ncbi:MAG: FeoB-associated Cys-rich membrane protein [Oscillospiraceae bacterium]|nr:FeoB-associated Cys-rich membrane protein [Oscillospiraceae bacterium]
MYLFIAENAGTIIVGGIVAAVVVAITLGLIKNKKQGKSSCGCGCKDCAMSGSCHTVK